MNTNEPQMKSPAQLAAEEIQQKFFSYSKHDSREEQYCALCEIITRREQPLYARIAELEKAVEQPLSKIRRICKRWRGKNPCIAPKWCSEIEEVIKQYKIKK